MEDFDLETKLLHTIRPPRGRNDKLYQPASYRAKSVTSGYQPWFLSNPAYRTEDLSGNVDTLPVRTLTSDSTPSQANGPPAGGVFPSAGGVFPSANSQSSYQAMQSHQVCIDSMISKALSGWISRALIALLIIIAIVITVTLVFQLFSISSMLKESLNYMRTMHQQTV